jgi:hypothetical protein
VRVARQGDRHAGLDRELDHLAGGIDLAHGLAQTGGGDLHRHAALGHRLDGRLVVAPQVAVGRRTRVAPHLHEIRVGDDVEQAAARGLCQRLEVAAPHLLGGGRMPPDVERGLVHVDGVVGDEVD